MKKMTFFLASLAHLLAAAPVSQLKECPKEECSPCLPCVPLPVTLGCVDSCFELNFAALVLQPYANNVDYGAEALPFNYGDAQPAVSPSWYIPSLSTDYHFGFDLGIKGNIRNAHTNISLNWERFHSSNDTGSITVSSSNDMVGTFFEIGPDASVYKKGKGVISFDFDQVNLNYGTYVDFGKSLRMNLSAGVGFNRLKQHWFVKISDLPETVIRTLDVPTQFVGAGPQIGFDFDYKIMKGFRFVGNSRATLFVGTFQNSTTYTTQSPLLTTLGDQNPNVQNTSVDDKGGIVPGLEGKLGFAYEAGFCSHYRFKIEAGYQAQVYLNAIRSIDMGSEVALASGASVGTASTGVYARTFKRSISDFALAGPYASIDFGF